MSKTVEEYINEINTKTDKVTTNTNQINSINDEITTISNSKSNMGRLLGELDETYNSFKRNGKGNNITSTYWSGKNRTNFENEQQARIHSEYGFYYWGVRELLDNDIPNLISSKNVRLDELNKDNKNLNKEITDLESEKNKL